MPHSPSVFAEEWSFTESNVAQTLLSVPGGEASIFCRLKPWRYGAQDGTETAKTGKSADFRSVLNGLQEADNDLREAVNDLRAAVNDL